MAISNFYASTIVKVSANFGFSGFACDPDEITRSLGIQPDKIGRSGQVQIVRADREIHLPINIWSLTSHIESKDVNDHLRDLLSRLRDISGDFPSDFGEPEFHILWKGNYLYAGSGPYFEADVIAGIARLKASLWQDIYQVDGEREGQGSAEGG